jgi:hypothetical protein
MSQGTRMLAASAKNRVLQGEKHPTCFSPIYFPLCARKCSTARKKRHAPKDPGCSQLRPIVYSAIRAHTRITVLFSYNIRPTHSEGSKKGMTPEIRMLAASALELQRHAGETAPHTLLPFLLTTSPSTRYKHRSLEIPHAI